MRLIARGSSSLLKAGSVARASHEGQSASKSRMILSSAWKGRTKAWKRSRKILESTWKKSTTQAGPVCHLTSQWSGRLRAARYSAAHRRVRCRKEQHRSGFNVSAGAFDSLHVLARSTFNHSVIKTRPQPLLCIRAGVRSSKRTTSNERCFAVCFIAGQATPRTN